MNAEVDSDHSVKFLAKTKMFDFLPYTIGFYTRLDHFSSSC